MAKQNKNSKKNDQIDLNLPEERIIEQTPQLLIRIMAFIADLIIINFILFMPARNILLGIAPTEISSIGQITETTTMLISTIMLFLSIIALSYFSLLEFLIKTTPGKMLFRLKIKAENNKLTLPKCILRSLFIIPTFPFVLLWVAEPAYYIFSKEKLRLTEKLTGTKIIQEIKAYS